MLAAQLVPRRDPFRIFLRQREQPLGFRARGFDIFAEAGIPTYNTPEEAVRAFMQIVQYRRNQNLLMQAPPSLPTDGLPSGGLTLTRQSI